MASSRQIEQIAAAWLARRDGDGWDKQAQAELEAWLAEATAHRVAFLRLEAAWAHGGRLKALGAGVPAGEIPARGQWARASFDMHERRAASDEDAPQTDATKGPPDLRELAFAPRKPQRSSRVVGYAGTAMAVVLAVALGWGWQRHASVEQASYLTALGDLRHVPLSDGSNATMSSDSRMQVSLSNGERRIDLQQGEAFFEVAKDPGRPFVVSAGGRQVVAVGTRFAVRRDGADLRVVVTEGTVRLQSEGDAGPRRMPITLLHAGNVALVSSRGVSVRTGSVEEAERDLDWRSGYVTFRDTPLEAAAAEFNRYNARKIVMGDTEVAAMRVGGNFRWSNTEAFVRLLEQGFPIRAERHPDRIVLHNN
ncbi:FecR family protein [Pseudoxanthomonas sacheonensis]|uniref:Transmembrane sensor n=1 Tax=Pseudoxanthomonas sacheonensis TaxID=443615 RepID=A0ABU1RY96_9GAMM|nr:FecR domain-containing protein [Pseudoxanthomonas sacheonensis]MDR6842930.1 transmembrane sensor [Pseudoxanthomonas sacheonensis]